MPSEVVLIAAVARNGVIGRDGSLPWHLPEDFRRYKAITTGHPMVMGRRTYESIGRPLPGRTTIVLTGQPGWHVADHPEVLVAADLNAALELARSAPGGERVFVAGGAGVYAEALGLADRLELTEVDADVEGDTRFPELAPGAWTETGREDRDGFAFVTYERPAR